MTLAPDDCYQALTARDARFDGAFFVGVTTTGIYCRPELAPGRARIDALDRLASRAESWHPWRSYAAIHLWRSLSAKEEKAK